MPSIKTLFTDDITRPIPPVVHFHEHSPERLASEVREYIVTGGWPENHPRHRKNNDGIHEQYISLLTGITAELAKKGGPELPASWISGFYGSGKSSFAKLLAFSLDGVILPDGMPLAEAWLRRDTSPGAPKLRAAWESLTAQIRPLAVVFDIGISARDGESLHLAIVRQLQQRLGYCPNRLVADFELKLECDGEYANFLATAEKVLRQPWSVAMKRAMAEDDFSQVLSVMFPDKYPNPMAWIRARAGTTDQAISVEQATAAIADMRRFRAPGRTLFIVIDEVSQYVHSDNNRMLAAQSLVQSLGQRLRGSAWLLVTGQEKLDDGDPQASSLHKMKDRFPPRLRVHLAPSNILDVVHQRLLHKNAEGDALVRERFLAHRSDLSLYAYGCAEVSPHEFAAVYPLLPGYIELLLKITSKLRRSSRSQGDDHAIRGLLQLLGELFRTRELADKELGVLISLDQIAAVQQSALDSDVQTGLARIEEFCAKSQDALALRVARAVALLELVQDELPTHVDLIASCLYDQMGCGDRRPQIRDALARLREANLVGYSEKQGYKIQSSAGQEWENERDRYVPPPEKISQLIQDALKDLVKRPDPPVFQKREFPWVATYSDDRRVTAAPLLAPRDEATIALDLRLVQNADNELWIKRSGDTDAENRLLWVASARQSAIEATARKLACSRAMIDRKRPQREHLGDERKRLFGEEETRAEDLAEALRASIEEGFLGGRLYFRGKPWQAEDFGKTFGTVLSAAGERVLPDIYNQHVALSVTPAEIEQILNPNLVGPSQKLLGGGLGILELDAGNHVATCTGAVPMSVLKVIEDAQTTNISAEMLFRTFSGPPCGYHPSLVEASLAGLLRAKKIRIQPEQGTPITSIRDPGIQEHFPNKRLLRKATIIPAGAGPITGRDRTRLCRLFEDLFGIKAMPREDEAIADAVFTFLRPLVARLRTVEGMLGRLPGRPDLPPELERLHKAFEDCFRSRQIEPTVLAVKQHHDVLRDGCPILAAYHSELDDDAVDAVKNLSIVVNHHLAQLHEVGRIGDDLRDAEKRLCEQLRGATPWRAIVHLDPDIATIRDAYRSERSDLLEAAAVAADDIRARIKLAGGATLTVEQLMDVLQPVTSAYPETTAEALAPRLVELGAPLLARLGDAEKLALERLYQFLSEKPAPTTGKVAPIRRLDLELRGREIATDAELDAFLLELRQRIADQLALGLRVRLG